MLISFLDTGKAPVIGTVDEALNGTYIFVILGKFLPILQVTKEL